MELRTHALKAKASGICCTELCKRPENTDPGVCIGYSLGEQLAAAIYHLVCITLVFWISVMADCRSLTHARLWSELG